MSKFPKISTTKWNVMKIIWEKAPLTYDEIASEVEIKYNFDSKKIYKIIKYLEKKQLIIFERSKSPYVCYPLMSEKECRKKFRYLFLDKLHTQ